MKASSREILGSVSRRQTRFPSADWPELELESAAATCVVAIPACIGHFSTARTQSLPTTGRFRGAQATVSPDRSCCYCDSASYHRRRGRAPRLWGTSNKLFKARNTELDQGLLFEVLHASMLVQQARIWIRWLEELEGVEQVRPRRRRCLTGRTIGRLPSLTDRSRAQCHRRR